MQVVQSLTVFTLESWLTTTFVVGGLGIEGQQNGLCKVLVWSHFIPKRKSTNQNQEHKFSWNSRVENVVTLDFLRTLCVFQLVAVCADCWDFCWNKTVNGGVWALKDRLCGLVVRVSGYRHRCPGFDSRHCQIFWVVVGLERGPLSLVSSIEELLE